MPPFSSPETRWVAIATRDHSASGVFVYCVISTKIYCRPTCPSRLARRANVVFHNTAAEAEAAGYRACMRCRPGEQDESTGDPQRIAVRKACDLIQDEEESQGTKWSVKNLAKEVGLTESHFCRVFKKITGVTVREFRAKVCEERRNGDAEVVRSKSISDVQVAASPPVYQIYVPGLEAQEVFDSELARSWQEFSGTSDLTGIIDMFPNLLGTDPTSFNFTPELVSDVSTPAITDDGFQYLNFDEVDSSTALYG